MNLDKKLELAHETLLKLLDKSVIPQDFKDSVSLAWVMTDAMEAEYNKRKQEEDKEKRQAVRDLLNDKGTFLEKEGEHFDDVANLCNTDSSSSFQVDWSQAPSWANWWAVDDGCSHAYWYDMKPFIVGEFCITWKCKTHINSWRIAPSFNYQGDWKDSLRKRPQEKLKQHQCNCSHWKGGSTFMGETHTCGDCGGWVMI